jgi:hypothetical protein
MPVQMTLLPAVACVLIAALLAFMLFAPSGTVVKAMNAFGGFLQGVVAKVKGLFSK